MWRAACKNKSNFMEMRAAWAFFPKNGLRAAGASIISADMKGKILGGILGGLAGGPWGAALGVAIGHAADLKSGKKDARGRDFKRELALEYLCAACAKVAAADGGISAVEIDEIEKIFADLRLNSQSRSRAAEYFKRAKDSPELGLADIAYAFANTFEDAAERKGFFGVIMRVALADARVSAAEAANLKAAARVLGIDARAVDEALFAAGKGGDAFKLAESYAVLGASTTDNAETLKTLYRKKCKELHPDLLRAKGLGDFAIEVLETELKRVNEAYAVICRARGIK